MTFDPLAVIRSPRLTLTPLVPGDAASMLDVYADPAMFAFTGGSPPTYAQLRARYEKLARGCSADGTEQWCNWIVRIRDDRDGGGAVAVGAMQATIEADRASIAWEIGVPWQRRGYASEAARAVADALRAAGVERLDAYVHPDHAASAAVARHAGLVVTDEVVDGERRWTWPAPVMVEAS